MMSSSTASAKRVAATGKTVARTGMNSKAIGSKSSRDSSAMVNPSKLNSQKVVPNRSINCDSVELDSSKNKEGSNDETVSSYIDSKCAEDEKVEDKPCDEASNGNKAPLSDLHLEERVEEISLVDEASNGTVTDEETSEPDGTDHHEDESVLNQRIDEMELRIEKLKEELREVAALEVSLYSVVPEHGSSAHKVHTPARRLSRLYNHACKNWEQDQRGSVAKNTASGFVLIAKSCGNDVPRLTFWLSNVIVFREIISQSSGTSKINDANRNGFKSERKPTSLKWKGNSSNGSMQISDDLHESGKETFISALMKVESWIFSRIVESVWWQALTPHMQPPNKNSSTNKSSTRMLGQNLNHQQGNFSVNLWRNAFQDAFQRICPVRAGGHECGCLPIIAEMVMEQCVARLDVAMFNAILRESAHETPTDPVSDPIVDSKVLPIPAGNLSFGSGAQLKNFVGNWTRWLSDMFGIGADDESKEDQADFEDENKEDTKFKAFNLLSELSDLLMLPKDMLMDSQVRFEVCPSIDLSVVKRILCYFTPDEFCPDPVPGAVLETLNSESVAVDEAQGCPYSAAPVLYSPPSTAAVSQKVAEAGSKSHLARNVSIVQRKGYTSDEELDELDFPLSSIVETSSFVGNRNKEQNILEKVINTRYDLLRPVWSE